MVSLKLWIVLDHGRKFTNKFGAKLFVYLIFASIHVLPFCEELFSQFCNLTFIDLCVDYLDRTIRSLT